MMMRRFGMGIALGFAAGVAASAIVVRLYGGGGFLANSWNTFFQPPMSATKILAVIAAALVFLALPFGIAEWASERRFRREERRLREERPGAEVRAYEGEEGHGVLFVDAGGRTLLLHPVGGIGAPRRIELPPEPPLAEPAPEPEPLAGTPPAEGAPPA